MAESHDGASKDFVILGQPVAKLGVQSESDIGEPSPINGSSARPWEAISLGSAVQPSNITRLHSSKSRPIDSARSGVARVASIPAIFTLFLLATFAHSSANLLLSYRVSSQTLTDFRLSAGIVFHGIGFLGPKV